MNWKFTDHAKYRLATRWFGIDKVKDIVRSPDREYASRGKVVADKSFGRETIRVVYTKKKNAIIIITIIRL